MGRCNCASTAGCSCRVSAGSRITVTGAGSAESPIIISSGVALAAVDTSTVSMTVVGNGELTSPWVISAEAALELGDLLDVLTAGPAGYVLAKDASGGFYLIPPSTAPVGTINHGNGISGDGSAGSPLNVRLTGSSGLEIVAGGLQIAGGSAWQNYTPTIGPFFTIPVPADSLSGRYSQSGKTVHFAANFSKSPADDFIGTTQGVWLSLPVPDSGAIDQVVSVLIWDGPTFADRPFIGTGLLIGDGKVHIYYHSGWESVGSKTASVLTPANTGLIRVSGMYEAA